MLKPRRAMAQPWRLERVVAERGETTTLVLKPPPGVDFRFEPGQFGWFAIGRSPFSHIGVIAAGVRLARGLPQTRR